MKNYQIVPVIASVMLAVTFATEIQDELRDNRDNEYWVREEITREQFLKYYKEMTGVDFFVDNESWEWEFVYE